MIRLALILTLLTFVGYQNLPKWRAKITAPVFQQCLNITPRVHTKNEIESLVCGSTLKKSRGTDDQTIQAWRNLGLIHILVVSGGHLSILATLLGFFARFFIQRPLGQRVFWTIVAVALILFCLANRLQPPVLRALVDWFIRKPLARRGWKNSETALMSTWFALPFSASIYDLLSLALSFFATVTVEQTARVLFRRKWLQAIALQLAVWWVLLPLLFTLGVPHPLTAMINIILAPLLGATLIPLAMFTWLSGLFPDFVKKWDPIGFGFLFDIVWWKISACITTLAKWLPEASPNIIGHKPLLFNLEYSLALLVGLIVAIGALLLRSRRESRRSNVKRSALVPLILILFGIFIAILVHRQLAKI